MNYTHNTGYSATESGFAVGVKGKEVPVIDRYGNLVNTFNNDGFVYHVDVNAGLDANNGLSWETSVKTYAKAVALSNATISASTKGAGRGWAARNTILFKGDNDEAHLETIVAFPNKCDVIGVGNFDQHPFPIMIGNHAPVATSMGCRFINMGFESLAAGGAIMTLTTASNGVKFLGCTFSGHTATPATYGLVTAANADLEVRGCTFWGPFSVAAIRLGAGVGNSTVIADNWIQSGAIGISVGALTCDADQNPLITNNKIRCTTLVIDDDSDLCCLIGNYGITAAADTLSLILDYNARLSIDNIISDATVTAIYPVRGTAATG